VSLASFLNNYRNYISSTNEGLSILSSLGVLFVFTLTGSVLGLEVFVVDPYGGAIN